MGEVLFCPFCRESFEGERMCPEHELVLVPFFQLESRSRRREDTERLAWYSPALGRGPVAAAAVLTLVAFLALPLSVVHGSVALGGSMLRLAGESTPKLWLVPASAVAMLMVLMRHRTPASMRGMRVLLPLLACVGPAVVLWSWSGVVAAVALLAERSGEALVAELASGAYVVLGAGALALFFGARLGVQRAP